MSELKWVKTTFGELKAGDVFAQQSGLESGTGYAFEHIFIRSDGDMRLNNWNASDPVYRLISPEREALEEIVAMTCDENDLDDLIATVRATFNIAKAALEVK